MALLRESAIYTLPEESNAKSAGLFSCATIARKPSPLFPADTPDIVFPAILVILPIVSIFLIRLLPVSAK